MAMRKYTLSEEFDLAELEIFALVCPLRPLQLAWNLNKFHSFKFVRAEDLNSGSEKNPSFHPVFLQKEPELMLDYRIIRNRGTQSFLMNTHKQADFLFCLRFEESCLKPEIYVDLRQLKIFQFVFQIPHRDVKEELKWQLMKDY